MAALGRYAKLPRSFWTDPAVGRLVVDAKVVLLYCLTAPHGNLIGLFHLPVIYIAEATGIPAERVRASLAGPLSAFVEYDNETQEVLVRRSATDQIGDDLKATDNRVKAVQSVLAETHSGRLVDLFRELHPSWQLTALTGNPVQAPPKPLASPSKAPPKQEKRSKREEQQVRIVFDYWRDRRKAILSLNGRGPEMKLTEKRASVVRARLEEGYTTEQLCEAVDGCLGSPRNVEGGHIDLELICRDQKQVGQYRAWKLRDEKNGAGPSLADSQQILDALEGTNG